MPDHPNYKHEREAIDWARAVLDQPDRYVILDTETTGVTNYDEVVQIGVIDPLGSVLYDTLIRPSKKKAISREATAIHGISIKMLLDQPTYKDASAFLQRVVKGKKIITYNADFDCRLLTQTASFSGGYTPITSQWQCAMLMYAQFIGEWDDYRNKYRWHRLEGGDHSALGDCMATLARIQQMAGARRRKYGYELWVRADEVVEGREQATPVPRPPRQTRPEREQMPFGISISLEGGVQYFGQEYKPPTIEEQEAELSDPYRGKLHAYEQATSCEVQTGVDVVKFLASSYRDMSEEEIQEAGTHLCQPRINGYIARPAIRCFTLMKRMETATPKKLFGLGASLKDALDQFTGGNSRDETVKKEATALQEIVEGCGRNELFFRSQIIWSDMGEKVRDKTLAIEKKSDRKKAMNEFIKKIKDLCDARSFRGLKEERERFIDYVKAQCDCG